MKKIVQLITFLFASLGLCAQQFATDIICAADQPSTYLPALKVTTKGRQVRIACLVNQTSQANGKHLVDYLLKSNVRVKKIFAPEHGFRGAADAGAHVKNGVDTKTGLPIISLYGKNKKPSATQLSGIDIVVFDIQDVGARYYTYISSLQYMMEACAENNIQLMVLDRPNPNGFYVDGPVLNKKYKSFVGMQAIPIVHGMTVGEYAKMLNGEKLLKNAVQCDLTVIKCKNYDHNKIYKLPIAPSPNLRSWQAILWYPTLCLFEGTEVGVGRGTKTPFEIWGHPEYAKRSSYSFTPKPSYGAKNPRYKYKKCYGENLHWDADKIVNHLNGRLDIALLKDAYSRSRRTDGFFTSFFQKLAGTADLKQQILAKKSVAQIRASWEPGLSQFKQVRKKYLLYPDFE